MQSNVARASEKESPAFRHGENVNEQQKYLEQRKRSKINIRHNSPGGKRSGAEAWLKTRHRVRRRLFGG
jgi:hypothetical protein